MMADIRVKFVSQKISKIRWRPCSRQGFGSSDVFATGSWDDESNSVSMWHLPGDSQGDEDMEDDVSDELVEKEPRLLCETLHRGDVQDLQFLGMEHLITASSSGTVSVFRHHPNSQVIGVSQEWDKLHTFPSQNNCSCTSVASQDETIVSCGEDGKMNVLIVGRRPPLRRIDNADSCTINDVIFLKQSEVVTVNSTGQLKVFDLRQPSDQPTSLFLVTGDQTALLCIDKHPTQHHVVAAGGQDGVLSVWDLRQEKYPVTLLEAHSAPMWEVKFHPNHPDHLFTCSEDGSVWHWNASTVGAASAGAGLLAGTGAGSGGGIAFAASMPGGSGPNPSHSCPWLTLDVSRHKMDITSLLPTQKNLPVNSIDIERQILLCGTDEEAIYAMELPAIR
ncbi:hypothetical protein CHS0354_001096 [Potamilus streckersoni]|uniref:Nucleoporin Nup43 n=1 Tax=Potamilus streckersoni TaxID=2493646 RepID=A0AAE0VJD6_9BIVA|nr:hypothetical protein CHS0354_001096 [Potamilus streckersoni]